MSLDDPIYPAAPGMPVAAEFVTATTVIVPDYDGGEHTFDVIVTPGSTTPAEGDRAFILQAATGEYLVVAWEPA